MARPMKNSRLTGSGFSPAAAITTAVRAVPKMRILLAVMMPRVVIWSKDVC